MIDNEYKIHHIMALESCQGDLRYRGRHTRKMPSQRRALPLHTLRSKKPLTPSSNISLALPLMPRNMTCCSDFAMFGNFSKCQVIVGFTRRYTLCPLADLQMKHENS